MRAWISQDSLAGSPSRMAGRVAAERPSEAQGGERAETAPSASSNSGPSQPGWAAGATGGPSTGSPRCCRIFRSTRGSEMRARTTIALEQRGQRSASTKNTRRSSCAHGNTRRRRPPNASLDADSPAVSSRRGSGSLRGRDSTSPGASAVGTAGGAGRRARHRERPAKIPWYRTRFVYGAGTSAASRRSSSSGSSTRHVAPAAFGHGRRSCYTTRPSSHRRSRSWENGARSP